MYNSQNKYHKKKHFFLRDLLDNKANNIQQFGFTFLIHLYDVISFPNKLVFVELIFEALSFLVIFQIIWFRYASQVCVNISEISFRQHISPFVPMLFGKWNPINISSCVSKWVYQIQNQMFALGYHLSAKSLLWFIQMMQETQFSPQLSIMIE